MKSNAILIIRFSSLGDIVLTTGVIKSVRDQRPDLRIDILTTSAYAPLFKDFQYVRDIYCVDKYSAIASLKKLIESMPNYEYVFDLHSNIRSFFAKRFLSGKKYTYNKNTIARRLFVKFKIGKFFLKKHTVKKYYDTFVRPLKLKQIIELESIRPFLPTTNFKKLSSPSPIITINPFASKGTKIWPHFAELANVLSDSGMKVRIIGDGKLEVPINIEDLTGVLTFQKLQQYIYESDVVVTTDSGPMHIATALGVSVLAIFGSTTKELGFYPMFKNCKVLEYPNLPCRPCHIHGLATCPKNDFSCMLSTTIEEARYNVMSMLSSNR